MAFLFESFVLPLSIVLSIPLAFLGVAWGHLLTGLDLDFLGMVGIVVLIGVVVNSARGNLVPDAWLAAIAIEAGCESVTLERDYARFPGLKWRLPG